LNQLKHVILKKPQHCTHLILNVIHTIPIQLLEGGFGGIFPTIDMKKSAVILETQMKILLYDLVPSKK